MSINISIDLANQIIGYLGTRPYQEVFQLVMAIQEAAASSAAQPKGSENGNQVDSKGN